MRINQFVARCTGKSRREADRLIASGAVSINGTVAQLGDTASETDSVTLNDQILTTPKITTVMLNKPRGYVCSREGQGSKTIYDLLPPELHHLKPVGRLDKDSSGLLLLTNDGQLAQGLTHPSKQKDKVYEVELNKELQSRDKKAIETGVGLEDGLSKLRLKGVGTQWTVAMSEGRNRQIRRTFEKLGYQVTKLHRTSFGNYILPESLILAKYTSTK